ncbi:capsular polysaccharide export protein, LipB/KpsS family [Robiginitalea sp. IMCC44478]|uniref:capsular polysaccharide export protein, LipB/KpsS family n=1 Tax=Robiginitalea sp. IMCC44478 TaxID=3459122 RepID=UPI004041A8E6
MRNIPFPSERRSKKGETIINLESIIQSDRQQNFFDNKNNDYFTYYSLKIEKILKEVKPDFVFGESTAFHELITVELSKTLNILYLNPSTCRYPTGRFSFYMYDSLSPYMGSGDILPDEEAWQIIQRIVKKESRPDYMKKTSSSKSKEWKDKLLKTGSYFMGEKYNTPNPLVKYKLEKNKKANIAQWEIGAISNIPDSSRMAVLYPLQIQPEANLDVWGRKWRDQTALIKGLADLLPEDTILYVKPNPKSKYELSDALVTLCQNHPKIIHISHGLDMELVFPKIDLVITVTGTIAIECILSNKPVLTLTETLNNSQPNCIYVDDLQAILPELDRIRQNTFPRISDSEKIAFINKLNSTSFEGEVNDPFTAPHSIEKKNREKILSAFRAILATAPSS